MTRSPQESPPPEPATVAMIGLGPIGLATLKCLHLRGFTILGAVDHDPRLVHRPVSELAGIDLPPSVRVFADFGSLVSSQGLPEGFLQCTVSEAATALTQLAPAIEAGCAIVSSCEELVFPWHRASEAADKAHRSALASGARVVAAGINPGFLLDCLPVFLSQVQRSVTAVRALRVVDARTRREPLQRKVGCGLPPESFLELFREKRAGHAGFQESVRLMAHAFGWPLDRVEESCLPVVADRPHQTAWCSIQTGQTRGLHQTVCGWVGSECRIRLELIMALDQPDPMDSVHLEGDPPVDLVLRGGVAGDPATAATMVSSLVRLWHQPPGLHLPTDLPIASGNLRA